MLSPVASAICRKLRPPNTWGFHHLALGRRQHPQGVVQGIHQAVPHEAIHGIQAGRPR